MGYSYPANGEGHAFSWTAAGGMVDLGTLGRDSRASAVSDGQVVGYSYLGDRITTSTHAVLFNPFCTGDGNFNAAVTVGEMVRGVNCALGTASLAQCPAFDCNNNGTVTVDCLVLAVNNALNGCSD